MSKLTDAEKRARAEQRALTRSTGRRLAQWDTVLSGVLSVGLLVWLSVYVREGNLQGALGSAFFWIGLVIGAIIFAILVRKFFKSARVARKV